MCFVGEVKLGVGEHFGNPELMENYQEILHWTYFHGWIIVLGICSVKISVGFFLLRLVQGKWYKVCLAPFVPLNPLTELSAVHNRLGIFPHCLYACVHRNTGLSVPPCERSLELHVERKPDDEMLQRKHVQGYRPIQWLYVKSRNSIQSVQIAHNISDQHFH